jgi:hypothetical protein
MADPADPGKDQASPRGRAADHVRPADTSATPEGRQRPPASGDASPSGVNSGRFGVPSAEAVGGAVFGGVTGGVVIGPAGALVGMVIGGILAEVITKHFTPSHP